VALLSRLSRQGLSGFGSVLVALPLLAFFLDFNTARTFSKHLGYDDQHHPVGATAAACEL